MKMNISKIIPFDIRIKTLYWVRKEKEIHSELLILFELIDNSEYEESRAMLKKLRNKWLEFSLKSPTWFQSQYITQFSKAEAMLNFLQDE